VLSKLCSIYSGAQALINFINFSLRGGDIRHRDRFFGGRAKRYQIDVRMQCISFVNDVPVGPFTYDRFTALYRIIACRLVTQVPGTRNTPIGSFYASITLPGKEKNISVNFSFSQPTLYSIPVRKCIELPRFSRSKKRTQCVTSLRVTAGLQNNEKKAVL